ncbi:tetratricopeptide repeat protein [Microcoleus sp. FACHB-831]|uniref:tetratricopeptide repeat protein n=1 Tax=Microcoleus sp. FACHB-831 TaxID=2692827 RepID=UPI0016845451|nr:tetratricopeptide repeat protein [Microcoleus sp. FACHB-831]MBD1923860.1 tetratricopeptide repeat protein [Microcoleus sp. FACHB-831]
MLTVAFVCVGWILSVCLHEFGHAVVAYWGGDTSVKDKGYLTLNPLKYIDPMGSIVLPVIFLAIGGIALPGAAVYIDKRRLRDRWWNSAVSAAGPIASILVTLLLAIPFLFGFAPQDSDGWIWPALAFLILLEIAAIILNLLPIPPLDGYGIIEPWLPEKTQLQLRKFGQYGIFFLFGLLWFVEDLNRIFWLGAYRSIANLDIPLDMVAKGAESFTASSKFLLLGVIVVSLLARRVVNPHLGWYDKAQKLASSQKYEEAIAAYDKAIHLKPDYYEAWHARGWALYSLGRGEDAIASYKRAIEIKPDFSLSWHNIGWVLTQSKRYEEAIAAYDKAIEIEPNDASIWTNRSLALGNLKRYADAIASCDKAIEINSEYAYAWYTKAGCYAEQGKVDLAIESLQRALALERKTFREYAKTDLSFDAIRDDERFQKLIIDR